MGVTYQTDYREAAVQLLTTFKAVQGLNLQIYPSRPGQLLPPVAFVDRMEDDLLDFLTQTIFQHRVTVEVMVLHGLFDSKDTVDQRDRFVDAFLDYVRTQFHAAGGNTLIRVRRVSDDPAYVPDWVPAEAQRTYFGTRIFLEGDATD